MMGESQNNFNLFQGGEGVPEPNKNSSLGKKIDVTVDMKKCTEYIAKLNQAYKDNPMMLEKIQQILTSKYVTQVFAVAISGMEPMKELVDNGDDDKKMQGYASLCMALLMALAITGDITLNEKGEE